VWRCPVSRSAGFVSLNGCATPCRLVNLPTCQKNTPTLQRRKAFTVLQVVTLLPNYTQSLFYQNWRSHSCTKLHAVTLLPNYPQSPMLKAALCPALHPQTEPYRKPGGHLQVSAAFRCPTKCLTEWQHLNAERETMVVTGQKIILKRISPLRHNILPALTLSNLYFLLRVYTYSYALVRNVPFILHTVCYMLHYTLHRTVRYWYGYSKWRLFLTAVCNKQLIAPRGLRLRTAAARLVQLRVRNGRGACLSVVSVVCCEVEVCCVSWGRGLLCVVR